MPSSSRVTAFALRTVLFAGFSSKPLLTACRANQFAQSLPSSLLTVMSAAKYTTEVRGQPNTPDFRLFLRDDSGRVVSPFHDVPLVFDQANRIFNMIVEIPRWTNAKMEIATKEKLNPIKQDVKKDQLRFVKNVFPHKGYIWNYGAFPQTWENPAHTDPSTGCKGDNDPIDVIEIGSRVHAAGSVIQVKVLGVMALIDEGETDWKVIVIDTSDSLSCQMNDVNDVEVLMPGLLKATHEWFKIYKIPDGKPANQFAFDGKAQNREFAEKVVNETHVFWKELIASQDKQELELTNVSNSGTAAHVSTEEAESVIAAAPPGGQPRPLTLAEQVAIDKWHFVSLA